MDLKQWIQKLNQLANNVTTSQKVNVQQNNNIPPFISNIFINVAMNSLDERFQQWIGNINILENGLVISHNQTNSYASVRGTQSYSQGQYHLRFQIENLTNNSVFFGIVSNDATIPDYPSIGRTAYGWSGLNNVWHDGIKQMDLMVISVIFKQMIELN